MNAVHFIVGLGLFAAGCATSLDTDKSATVLMQGQDDAGFWDFPYPSDLRVDADGHPIVEGFPNPNYNAVVTDSLDYIHSSRRHYGPLTSVYFRLSRETQLPWLTDLAANPRLALEATAALQIIDIDPDSPEYGQRRPLVARLVGNSNNYGAPGLLAMAPYPGYPLRVNTRYAAVVLRSLAEPELKPAQALRSVLEGEAPSIEHGWITGAAMLALYAPALKALQSVAGLVPDDIAGLTVFSTDDPQAPLYAAHKDVTQRFTLDRLDQRLTLERQYADYCVLTGTIPMPQFQQGVPLYFDGLGQWRYGPDGKLQVMDWEDIPVAVSIPKGAMPANGWPLTIYIHGTAGLSTQFIDRSRTDEEHRTVDGKGPAEYFAHRGIAMAGAALPVNPQRVPQGLGWGMYNLFEPQALVSNLRQGAVEQALWMRAVAASSFAQALCPDSDASATSDGRIRFRQGPRVATGQSLGSMELALWSVMEDEIQAVVPTGAGAYWGYILPRMTAMPGDGMFRTFFRLDPAAELDALHPAFFMAQWMLEPIDPGTTVQRWYREPYPGVRAKHILYPAGVYDAFFQPPSIGPYALIAGLQPTGADLDAVLSFSWQVAQTPPQELPQNGNARSPDDEPITAVLVQYPEDGILSGHDVVFQYQEPKYQIGCFVRDVFDGLTPTVRHAIGDARAACD